MRIYRTCAHIFPLFLPNYAHPNHLKGGVSPELAGSFIVPDFIKSVWIGPSAWTFWCRSGHYPTPSGSSTVFLANWWGVCRHWAVRFVAGQCYFARRLGQQSGCGAAVLPDCPGAGCGVGWFARRCTAISSGRRQYRLGAGRHSTWGSVTIHGAALRAESTVGAGCCSAASHRQSPWHSSTSVAAVSGGPVPGGAISRVDLFIGCAFRKILYRYSDNDMSSGEFGLPVHHPRFIEWIGTTNNIWSIPHGG